jgi:hypothetical protein
MPKNINISSGSKSFQNKIFGSIVKLTKPSFAYDGKIFSDNIFDNQKTIPLLENNTYYIGHGLPDSDVIYGITQYSFSLDNQEIQSDIVSIMQLLNFANNTGPVASRATVATLTSLSSSTNGAVSVSSGGSVTPDPYNNNPPPPCSPP